MKYPIIKYRNEGLFLSSLGFTPSGDIQYVKTLSGVKVTNTLYLKTLKKHKVKIFSTSTIFNIEVLDENNKSLIIVKSDDYEDELELLSAIFNLTVKYQHEIEDDNELEEYLDCIYYWLCISLFKTN